GERAAVEAGPAAVVELLRTSAVVGRRPGVEVDIGPNLPITLSPPKIGVGPIDTQACPHDLAATVPLEQGVHRNLHGSRKRAVGGRSRGRVDVDVEVAKVVRLLGAALEPDAELDVGLEGAEV